MAIVLPTQENLKKASAILKNGGIIAYPTETFYAIGVDPFNKGAVKKLFELKGRGFDKPISIIIKDIEALSEIAEDIPSAAKGLMEKLWPGPLTIVFNAKKIIPAVLTANTDKIGIRISSNPVAKKLLDVIDMPITATSANPSGEKSPVTANEVENYFGNRLDMILAPECFNRGIGGGILEGKLGSTIVDVTEGGVKILRHGDIPEEMVKEVI